MPSGCGAGAAMNRRSLRRGPAGAHELGEAADAAADVLEPALVERLVISSRPNTRRPVAAPISVPTGAGVSGARALVRIASRPRGASTRAIASSAAPGSSNRCSAAKQQIASKAPSRNGSWTASPRR